MKKYILVTYNSGNVLNMVSFDNISDIKGNEFYNISNIDKIKLFKLNKSQDGRNLIKEFKIYNNNLDDIIQHKDTKILKYEIIKSALTESIFFRVVYKISPEIQKKLDLWYQIRFLDFRLIQSNQDEAPAAADIQGGGYR